MGYPVEQTIWRAKVLCTEAYAANLDVRLQLCREFDNGLPYGLEIDCYMSRYCRQYLVYPPLFCQYSGNESSIGGYGCFMETCMNLRSRYPRLTAAVTLSIVPILITLLAFFVVVVVVIAVSLFL